MADDLEGSQAPKTRMDVWQEVPDSGRHVCGTVAAMVNQRIEGYCICFALFQPQILVFLGLRFELVVVHEVFRPDEGVTLSSD